MTDPENLGPLPERPAPAMASPEVVSLSQAEHALYSSAIRKGHCESLRQMASQLREAAASYRAASRSGDKRERTKVRLEQLLEAALSGYDSFAEQLDEPAKKACAEQQRLLARFLATRRSPGVVDRIAAAARGALGGWRGR